MATEVGLTQSAVLRIWRAFGLQPHRQETLKLSKDPLFIDKVRDVVGIYFNPPESAVVLCVDEKSQIQALDRTAPILPMLPGTPERATHDYKRAGTSSLFAALDITTGKVIGALHSRHRAIEFEEVPATKIDREVPADLDVHLVLDNSSTHKTPAIHNWLAAHPRFRLALSPRRRARGSTSSSAGSPGLDDQRSSAAACTVRSAIQDRHPRLDRALERRSHALHLDQDRRPDPRIDRPLLPANRFTTLVGHGLAGGPARVGRDPGQRLVRRQRPGEVEALAEVAAERRAAARLLGVSMPSATTSRSQGLRRARRRRWPGRRSRRRVARAMNERSILRMSTGKRRR